MAEQSDTRATGASPEFSGTVEINTLGSDPARGLINLPLEAREPKVAQGCQSYVAQNQSEFFITGRGGKPPNPREVLKNNAVYVPWVTLDADTDKIVTPVESRDAKREINRVLNPQKDTNVNNTINEIVEAQGWIVDKNGDVTLVAQVSTATPHSPAFPTASCSASYTISL